MSYFSKSADFAWHEPPGHAGAYSQYLVSPEGTGSDYFDFRLSRYPKGGKVTTHTHEVAEHVYYFTAGRAIATCGDEERTVGPGELMFVPAAVPHSVESIGDQDLCFVLATSPPSDIERVDNPVERFADAGSKGRGSLQVIARWQAAPGTEGEITSVLEQLSAASLAETGCMRFEILVSREQGGLFFLVEEYRDEEAFERHRSSVHFTELVLGTAMSLGVERTYTPCNRFAG